MFVFTFSNENVILMITVRTKNAVLFFYALLKERTNSNALQNGSNLMVLSNGRLHY